MKKLVLNIIASIIGITIFTSDFAFAKLPVYEVVQQVQSQLNLEDPYNKESPLIAKAVKWVSFKQTFGRDKVSIEFPKKPTVKKEEGLLNVETTLEDTEYSFIAPYRALGENTDSNLIFDLMLNTISGEIPEENFEFTTYIENGRDVLEVSGFDPNDKEWFKLKVIVTKQNFYMIGVACKNNRLNPLHDRFINSITIR